jgi:hypothetical protein
MAASAVIAPEEESVLENETVKARKPKIEPKPAGPAKRIQNVLFAIFAGHEEFLGRTPD